MADIKKLQDVMTITPTAPVPGVPVAQVQEGGGGGSNLAGLASQAEMMLRKEPFKSGLHEPDIGPEIGPEEIYPKPPTLART